MAKAGRTAHVMLVYCYNTAIRMAVPKTATTRLVLPRGVANTPEEPPAAEAGTLSFDATTDTVRYKTATVWADLSGGGGGGGGPATALDTTGAPVDVSGADPPVPGEVLTAIDATHAEWRVPGLRYDPAIKFWTGSTADATIEPGTWGFVTQPPSGSGPIIVHVVSSMSAPPVDSRFGLYVGANVTRPVEVHLIGTSQIMAPDGTLSTTCTLYPRAYYEWIFYHEDSTALWGMVADTAGVARSIMVTGGTPVALSGTAPTAGQVLTATSSTAAGWSSSAATLTGNPYLDPPSIPDSFNVEFGDAASPDLAVLGFTVVNSSTGAAITRGGDVDLAGTTLTNWSATIPNNTYRSTIRQGRLFLQFASGQQVWAYKANPGAAASSYFLRFTGFPFGQCLLSSASIAGAFVQVNNRRVFAGVGTAGSPRFHTIGWAENATYAYSYNDVVVDGHDLAYLSYNGVPGSSAWNAALANAPQQLVGDRRTFSTAGYGPYDGNYIGIHFYANASALDVPWFELWSLRRYSGYRTWVF